MQTWLAFLMIFVSSAFAEERNSLEGYQLVWSDEFKTDGPPNPQNWTFEHGFCRNHEAQWYQPENAFCQDGKLIIEGRRERKPNPAYQPGGTDWKNREFTEYTSASLLTKGRHSWLYGRFEVRAKISAKAGLWPAETRGLQWTAQSRPYCVPQLL